MVLISAVQRNLADNPYNQPQDPAFVPTHAQLTDPVD